MKHFKLFIAIVGFCLAVPSSVSAAPVWGSDASGELMGSRQTGPTNGVTGEGGWEDDGDFTVSWVVTQDGDEWTYQWTISGAQAISHGIIEVTEGDEPFNILDGTDTKIEGPKDGWKDEPGNANPGMPNDLYGIKFDFEGNPVTYTLVTDRAPVYGVGYWKDGVGPPGHGPKTDTVAWTNALNFSDYKTNETLTLLDFIVRPDGSGGGQPPPQQGQAPEPATGLLALVAGAFLARRRRRVA